MISLTNYQKGKLRREYDDWYRDRYPDVFTKRAAKKKSKYIKNDPSLDDSLEILKEILKKLVIKMDFSLDPVEIAMSDTSGEFVSRAIFDFGNIEVLIDELYSKRHFLKFLGIRLESRKTIKILHGILKVSNFYQFLG